MIGSAAWGLSTSAPGSAPPRVRAVSTALQPCLVLPGARVPPGRWAGRNPSCVGTSVVAAADTPAVRGAWSPSRFRPASLAVGLAVGGRAGRRLAPAWGRPGRSRTMVRLLHGAPFPALVAPRVRGLEEWAWRRLSSRLRWGSCSPIARPHRSRRGGRPPPVSRSSAALAVASTPQGFGRGRRRRSRSSIVFPWGTTGVRPWRGSCAALDGHSTGSALGGGDPPLPLRPLRRSARRVTPAGASALTRGSACVPSTWGVRPSPGASPSVARPSRGLSPGLSRPSGHGHGPAGRPWSRPAPPRCDGGGMPAVARPRSAGGREGPRDVGPWRRETGTRGNVRQGPPAP